LVSCVLCWVLGVWCLVFGVRRLMSGGGRYLAFTVGPADEYFPVRVPRLLSCSGFRGRGFRIRFQGSLLQFLCSKVQVHGSRVQDLIDGSNVFLLLRFRVLFMVPRLRVRSVGTLTSSLRSPDQVPSPIDLMCSVKSSACACVL